jgi:hypothetical protein
MSASDVNVFRLLENVKFARFRTELGLWVQHLALPKKEDPSDFRIIFHGLPSR